MFLLWHQFLLELMLFLFKNIVVYCIFYAEQVVKQVIKWINEEHDEFALAVASDHGGQFYYGEDALCNHG